VGLAVSYALSVTGLLNGVVTAFTETEKQMVSVERAGEYITTTPTEKDWAILCVSYTGAGWSRYYGTLFLQEAICF